MPVRGKVQMERGKKINLRELRTSDTEEYGRITSIGGQGRAEAVTV
jgi:hypothetical protein